LSAKDSLAGSNGAGNDRSQRMRNVSSNLMPNHQRRISAAGFHEPAKAKRITKYRSRISEAKGYSEVWEIVKDFEKSMQNYIV
jgi:hypothetical protein